MPQGHARQNLPTNLRYLCRHRKSVSAVARDTGVNRQQFEKYLSGKSFPSENVRHRLAQHFEVPIEALTQEPSVLRQTFEDTAQETPQAQHQFPQSEPIELSVLRHYIGSYQTYFLTPAWPGRIFTGLVFVTEHARQINTVFFNRARDPDTGAIHRSRLDGRIVLRGERLFLFEKTRKTDDRFSETILFPSHRHSGKYLTGMSFGVTWRPHRMPFASRTIWRRIPPTQRVRTSIATCGIYDPGARSIDPIVRNFFGDDLRSYTMNALPT